ncbi:phosphatase 2C [Thalictrum thalictroides]|uniref:protein-serine/threonine phosphatase n=1 Tax=Thalictrum thalictroides TaxID=46969 RepID=A0A7J6W019_THATH|nr:phosphatase 2C [Thalictrum thalictroides]
MAEICCGVATDNTKTTVVCEPSTREARKRRMELRRFKIVPGMAGPPEHGKRRKIEVFPESSSGESSSSVDRKETDHDSGSDVTENSNSSSKSNESWSDSVSENSHLQTKVVIAAVLPDRCPNYGVTSVCGRRRDMEDAVAIHPSFCRQDRKIPADLHYFGVYDGHGCSHVAMTCKDRLHELVKEEIEKKETFLDQWKETMERSFSRMDREVLGWTQSKGASCRCELQTPKCDAVGSTAVVSVVTPEKIITANCGDSRAVLCRGGKAIPLSSDHKPDRPDELLRIQAAGGRVIYWDGARVLGVLAMSRAIGDDYLKPYVCSDPEVTITDRTVEDDCLILASDGLWDVLSNETVCSIARMVLNGQAPCLPSNGSEAKPVNSIDGSDKACSDAALLLTKLAMARNSTDNVSVIVVDLRRNT